MILLNSTYKNIHDTVYVGRPKGYVQIFERNRITNSLRILNNDNNHVVYTGREWLPQRAFNIVREANSDVNTWAIYWFGVGTGGATIDDPFNPLDVELTDTDLAHPIIVDPNNNTYADGGKKMPFDNIEILEDPDEQNKYLLVQIDVTITAGIAVGEKINECGLYASETKEPSASNFILFARYTFSTIELTNDRDILFRWKVWF